MDFMNSNHFRTKKHIFFYVKNEKSLFNNFNVTLSIRNYNTNRRTCHPIDI